MQGHLLRNITKMRKFFAFVLLMAGLNVRAQLFAPTNEINGTYDAASWDLGFTSYMGDYFCSAISAMYPQWTNHMYSWSRSGSGWTGDYQSQEEKWCLPLWYSFRVPGYNWVVAGDNEGLTSNQVYAAGLNIAAGPPLFYNGTAQTNEGIATVGVQFVPLGAPPHDSGDGQGVNKVGNDASTNLAVHFGTPVIDLWNLCWHTSDMDGDEQGNRYAWHPLGGSHFSAAGGLIVALWQLKQFGLDTNVGNMTFDWGGSRAFTNQCCAANISVSGNTLTATVRWNRLPPPFDANGGYDLGSTTNDARYAFGIDFDLGMMFRWMLQVTNAPVGNYTVYLDGKYCDQFNDVQGATGRNWFSNCVPTNPTWQQRSNILAWKRWQKGADPVTLNVTDLGSGHTSHIPGAIDYQFYTSHAAAWNSSGLRGMAYLTNNLGGYTMTNDVALYSLYDVAIHDAAQPQTFTLTIVLNPAAKHPRIRK
jgi:hypothetical protein